MIKMIGQFRERFGLTFLKGWALHVHSVAPPPLVILDGHSNFAWLNSDATLAACLSNGRLNLVDGCACY
jgi:hypothetical protein